MTTKMSWTELLRTEIEGTYHAAFGLMEMVDEAQLGWRPATGENWMTTGQLLAHLATACGACCRGFVTGDWGMPSGDGEACDTQAELSTEEMLPPAAKMPSVNSVGEARERLEADKRLALEMVAQAGEDGLASRMVAAPWNPQERPLGHQFLQMVMHLSQHKGQLFYYLKLQGRPVHTGHLWGM